MIKKLLNKLFGRVENAMPFGQGLDLTGIPIVTFKHKDMKLNFVLDTGSSNCSINEEIVQSLEYDEVENKSTNLIGMDGIKRIVPHCKIALSYKEQTFEYEFLISDMSEAFKHIKKTTGVTLHGIIGSDFFNQYKYILDFNELIAYSKA